MIDSQDYEPSSEEMDPMIEEVYEKIMDKGENGRGIFPSEVWIQSYERNGYTLSLIHIYLRYNQQKEDIGLSRRRHKKSPVAAICGALGTALLIALVVFCIPLTVPRIFGYHIYSVVSGSMEPAIPVGSLVYIQEGAPEDMQEDDVIAFYGARDSNAIITHRVVENRVVMGEFITKGDANQTEDMNPVPYSNFIGKVVLSIPVMRCV